jgi:hypothetical protein
VLDEPCMKAVPRAAVAQAEPPLPCTGEGPTVDQSVSAKQRPGH